MQPHRWQPTRLCRRWDSPGKNIGVGCHFLLQCMKGKSESEVAQLCPTLSDPMDCNLPGSSVHGIFQARVPEWVAIAFSETYAMGLLLLLSFLCSFLCYCSQERQVRWQPLARTKDGSLSLLVFLLPSLPIWSLGHIMLSAQFVLVSM